GNLRLYDVQSGKVKGFQLSEPKKKNMITYCITFTPDGKAVVTGHEFGNAARVTPLDKFTDIQVAKEKPKPPEPKKEEKDKKETEKKKETKKADKQLVRAASVSERWSEIRSLTLAALTDTSRSCALAL